VTEFVSSVPIIPARDVAVTAGWYRDQLGYDIFHLESGYGILGRGESWLHLWGPSEIEPAASMTMLRVGVRGIDDLYEHCRRRGVMHANGSLETKPWTFREFAIADCDGNLVTFFEPPVGYEPVPMGERTTAEGVT
jgi:hypothetical protein